MTGYISETPQAWVKIPYVLDMRAYKHRHTPQDKSAALQSCTSAHGYVDVVKTTTNGRAGIIC